MIAALEKNKSWHMVGYHKRNDPAVVWAKTEIARVKSTGEELVVKSAEDTVLRKLLWYRDGGGTSEKQWRDLVEVLRVSGPQMQPLYLDTWASRLGIDDLLARARAEASV